MSQAVGQQSPWQLGTIPCSLSGCQKKNSEKLPEKLSTGTFPFCFRIQTRKGLRLRTTENVHTV